MLTSNQAINELNIAGKLNPGVWQQHSLSVEENAKQIAKKCGMDSDRAYVFGLMHDIGRRNGIKGILHIFDGYEYMMSIGQPEIARICLTHSFPIKDISSFSGKYDCNDAQKEFLNEFLISTEFDDYDKLIQLCDAISLPNGACIVEKRLVDVALRHGFSDTTLDKWRGFLKLKSYFDQRCGCNIYELLPDVFNNSSISLV